MYTATGWLEKNLAQKKGALKRVVEATVRLPVAVATKTTAMATDLVLTATPGLDNSTR